jgi:hypothetical protein
VIRVPTDPDPYDEPRGISGYTFAFAGEPDLDRVIYLHESESFELRSRHYPMGVFVTKALRREGKAKRRVPALEKARVDLLDKPRLENRNWVLTPPAWEPIVPFHLRIDGDGVVLDRKAPLDPKHPEKPLWQIDRKLLLEQAARGIYPKPGLVQPATGIFNSRSEAQKRRDLLSKDLDELRKKGGDPVAITRLKSRIAELEIGLRKPDEGKPEDRRIAARDYVEEFGFELKGDVEVEGREKDLEGVIDESAPWRIDFWLGGWDPDLLQAYMKGTLLVPYER